MAAPVVLKPATTETNNVDGGGSYYRYKERSAQAKPYNLPAPYLMRHVVTTSARKLGLTTSYGGMANASATKSYRCIGPYTPDASDTFSVPLAQAINSARDKLVSGLQEEAMLAVNWAERKQAMDMINNRAMQVFQLVRSARNRTLYRIPRKASRRSLRQAMIDGARGLPRSAARTWLEFHFGWEPLIKDIAAAVELLQGPLPSGHVKKKGSGIAISYDYFQLIDPVFRETVAVNIDGSVQASAGAHFYVDNPDLFLANRLGFVNPASFVWELVPYSFVVDWFVNVGQFLDQFSDLSGLRVEDPYYTWVMKVPSCSYIYRYSYDSGKTWNGREVLSEGVWVKRTLGIPSVTLGLRPMKRLSVSRAATAVSLLIGQLKNASR